MLRVGMGCGPSKDNRDTLYSYKDNVSAAEWLTKQRQILGFLPRPPTVVPVFIHQSTIMAKSTKRQKKFVKNHLARTIQERRKQRGFKKKVETRKATRRRESESRK